MSLAEKACSIKSQTLVLNVSHIRPPLLSPSLAFDLPCFRPLSTSLPFDLPSFRPPLLLALPCFRPPLLSPSLALALALGKPIFFRYSCTARRDRGKVLQDLPNPNNTKSEVFSLSHVRAEPEQEIARALPELRHRR